MRRLYDNIITVVDNEGGMTMVITLMLLLLLTVIGVAAITTSTTETMISSAETEKKSTFYAAESGVEHVTGILRTLCIPKNQARINQCRASVSSVCKVDWNFALDGTGGGLSPAKDILLLPPKDTSNPTLMERFDAGAKWILKDMGHGYNYDVRVWNNDDSGSYIDDKDGTIYLVAVGTGPNKGKSAIEVVLAGTIEGSGLSSYMGQSAAGSGKNSNSLDTGRMSNAAVGSLGQLMP